MPKFILLVWWCFGCIVITGATVAEIRGTAHVERMRSLNGEIEGGLQLNRPQSVTLNGGAAITGALMLPGSPTLRINGNASAPPISSAGGAELPNSHRITINGHAILGSLVTQQDPIAWPVVPAIAPPPGTRRVSLNRATDSVESFDGLRDLTLNGNGLVVDVPPGRYGTFTLNGNNRIRLGGGSATDPSHYEFQRLRINGQSSWEILGPVRVTLGSSLAWNGAGVSPDQPPEWLDLRLVRGNLTLNGKARFAGFVTAPKSRVTLNGRSVLEGGLIARELVVNGGGTLRLVEVNQGENIAPVVTLVQPEPDAVFEAPAIFKVEAQVIDPEGDGIESVVFSLNDQVGGTVNTAPFEFEVGPLVAGSYRLQAVAKDIRGAEGISAEIGVLVIEPLELGLPFAADFEAAEGYELGWLAGQLGWQGLGDAVVSDADALSGDQSVLLGGGGEAASASLTFAAIGPGQLVQWSADLVPVSGSAGIDGTVIRLAGIDLGFVRDGNAAFWQTLPLASTEPSIRVSPSVPVDGAGVANQSVNLGIRADYLRRVWDVLIDGHLVAHDLAMAGAPGPEFLGFIVSGGGEAATVFDAVTVGFSAPWFVDGDNDGLDDDWEAEFGLDSTRNDRMEDPDEDGLSNVEEFQLGLRPDDPDTDGDELYDGDEVFYGWDALNPSPDLEPPQSPTTVEVLSVGEDRVVLSWPAATDNVLVAGYLVYRDGESIDTPEPIHETTFTDEGLVSGETYYYAVQSFDFAGNLSAITVEIDVTTLPEDTDGDGLSDEWENRYFLEEGARPDEDVDGDGMTNAEEHAMGTHPQDFFNGVVPSLLDPYAGAPSPEDTLVVVVRHPDGTPWPDAPVTFIIDVGSRRIAAEPGSTDYVTELRVRSDDEGVATAYLEPLTP